ncbi:MAG TPA: MarR family transcriptional regulator [Acidimicrobiia bacterium]|nr:MarR family transcriptional regulator [Acidimicrobiia bacterium]
MTEVARPAPQWLSEPEMQAWKALVATATGVLATLDRELQTEHGISLAEYEVLVHCSEQPEGSIRMSDLASAIHLSPSGMTRRIDAMVRRGLVRREACPTDRRAFNVLLTDEGCTLLREAAPTHLRGVRAHFIDRLSPQQLTQLADAFSAIEIDPAAAAGGCDRA